MITICGALAEFINGHGKATTRSLSHCQRAIEIDPDFASAFGLAARCYGQRKTVSLG